LNTEELAGLRNAIKMKREEEEGKGTAVCKACGSHLSSVEPQNSISQVSYQLRRSQSKARLMTVQ
jgi:hypothetical protein